MPYGAKSFTQPSVLALAAAASSSFRACCIVRDSQPTPASASSASVALSNINSTAHSGTTIVSAPCFSVAMSGSFGYKPTVAGSCHQQKGELSMNSEWVGIDVHGFTKADPGRPQRAAAKLNGAIVTLVFDEGTGVYRLFGPGGSFELPVELNRHLTMIIEGDGS